MYTNQKKLTRHEWNKLEIKCENDELNIINMINDGYNNININENKNVSLISILKLNKTDSDMHTYLYNTFFKTDIESQCKKYKINFINKNKTKNNIKKADIIKINNIKNINNAYEFTLLKLIKKMLKNYESNKENKKSWIKYYYTIYIISKYNIDNRNIIIQNYTEFILDMIKCDIIDVLYNSYECIETNNMILDYKNNQLFNHQKELFTICKNKESKLVLYIAPTGTGKTLSPIGLSNEYKVIFVCAARHVGLALAKNLISIQKKIAIAFDCDSDADIKLHYYSVKDAIRSKKSGGIVKIDNTKGENVEIIICDIKSYLPAMNYLCKFNNPENIIMYWDEPTISLDYENHEIHKLISNNWKNNIIPNIILSSATLPSKTELNDVINNFKTKFNTNNIYEIKSYECNKTITLLNKENMPVLPHLYCKKYVDLQLCVNHCINNKTVLRYFNLNEIIEFIIYCDKNQISDKQNIEKYFKTISDLSINNIKIYYLYLLKDIFETKWDDCFRYFDKKKKSYFKSTIYLTTNDAHTITDGPCIFLTEDPEKIAKFFLQKSNIPDGVLNNVNNSIEFNNNINDKIDILEKELNTLYNKNKSEIIKETNETKELNEKIKGFKSQIKSVTLGDIYIPNKKSHYEHWNNSNFTNNLFSSSINTSSVEKIMNLNNINNLYKILLLMGIGVFIDIKDSLYLEVVKELAQQQKLFVIIASSDYIYGTNYQFCHAYLSKDLEDNTQEKIIQSMGRVGRKQIQQIYTVRLRSNNIINKILYDEDNKLEVINMNKLLS